MARLQNPLSPAALDEYIRDVFENIMTTPPADAAAVAAAITAYDDSAAVQQERFRQLMNAVFTGPFGDTLEYGQVASLAITTAGTGYAVGDAINVTTSTGTGAAARVSSVDGSGAILDVELITGGMNYDAVDTATTITTTGGSTGVITATIAPNYKKMLEDARAILIP